MVPTRANTIFWRVLTIVSFILSDTCYPQLEMFIVYSLDIDIKGCVPLRRARSW